MSPYPVCNHWLLVPLLGILRVTTGLVGSGWGLKAKGSCLIQGAPIWAASFPWRHVWCRLPLGLLECCFQTPSLVARCIAVWTAPGVLPLQAHHVAPCGNQSPGWGLLYSSPGGWSQAGLPPQQGWALVVRPSPGCWGTPCCCRGDC